MTIEKLLSVGLLFCSFAGAFSLRFYTRYNRLCVTECAEKGSDFYSCYYGSQWDYCSTLKNVDYLGRACRDDHPCGKYGSSYSWCYVDSDNNWGYCGTQRENFKVVASNGYYCIDDCRYYSSGEYYWCNTENDWQYCSPKEGQDYQGKQCRPNHFCDKHGESYYWCYVDNNNNWGYCGIDGESKHLTYKAYYCSTECEKDGTDYFWCRSFDRWGYCSPTENSDSHGRACRADHDCAKHDYNYNWCFRNENGDWDYCGHLSDCSYLPDPLKTSSERLKRQLELVCDVNNQAHRIHTDWLFERNANIIQDVNGNVRSDAVRAVSHWNLGEIAGNAQAGTLINMNTVRVDLQGMINRDGIRYANIQIQINTRRTPGRSTTIAAVLVQANQDMPVRYIRRALLYSLQQHGTIVLRVRRQ